MRSSVLALVVILALLATVAVVGIAYRHRVGIRVRIERYLDGRSVSSRHTLRVGERFPDVKFLTLDGSRAPLASRPGRIMLVDVFTTWCPDCIDEAPALQGLAQATARLPVDIVGIDQQEDATTINRFMASHGLNYPVVIDDQNVTEEQFGVHYIPVAYLVDSRGIVRGHIIGPQTLPELQRLVDDALHNRPVGLGS